MTILLAALLAASPADDFRDKVAPILESKCVRCHGQSMKKGGLSLHSSEALKVGGDSGPAIEPSKPEHSLLIEKVTGEKPEMPKGGAPLSTDEVATLKAWIAAGASWPEGVTLTAAKAPAGPWWAVQPLKRPGVPWAQVWNRNPIDAFVLRGMSDHGLTPSPEADRRTLIRRLTFDLHGLPPTPEEIDAFLDDKHPDAYERLVDRLLASPRYGERWARHWLDVAHYADTHGYDKDKPRRNAWRYRDYVIKSFNDDKPYDRFVEEQIAGDVLYPGDPDATIATGFLAAGPWDFVGHAELREGTVDKDKTRLIDRDDMLAIVMSTFTSLTVHCARCHDHKFDPISQKDYYKLQAVFAGVDRGDRAFSSASAERLRADVKRSRKEAIAKVKELHARARRANVEVVRLDEEFMVLEREATRASRPTPQPTSPTNGYHSAIQRIAESAVWVQVDLGQTRTIDLIRLIPARPTDFPDSPGFGFPSRFKVEASDDPKFAKSETVVEVDRDESQPDRPWVIRPKALRARYVRVSASRLWKRTEDYVFALAEVEILSDGKNVAAGATVTARDSIEAGRWSTKYLVDGFDSRASRPASDDPAEAARDKQILLIHDVEGRRARLIDDLVGPEIRGIRDRIMLLDRELDIETAADLVYAVLPHPPRSIHLLKRGDVEQPGEAIGPGAPSCVPGLKADFSDEPDEGKRRADLAAWMTHRDNVLTWRSIVNRVWHHHFGRGLVDTPNDFGQNGGFPTHPELLDWLAVEFRDGGGSLKCLHRLIVTSATYRQSSASDPAKSAIDGDNRFLWRHTRQRIEAESVRDAVLAVCGQLDLTMGGPGFEPFRFKDDHSPIYDHEAIDRINAPECRRRAIYRFTVRSVPNPFVECLDGADPNVMTPVRNTTITALQALTLLNDPFMIRQSEAFAARLEAKGGDRPSQVEAAFLLVFGRPPRANELRSLIAHAERHGMAKACRILLNANEFVFVD